MKADGTITTFADQLQGQVKANFYGAYGLARAADGTLYVLSASNYGLTRIAPDNTMTSVIGTGRPGFPTIGAVAATSQARPWCVMLEADGTVLLGEDAQSGMGGAQTVAARVLSLGKDGLVGQVGTAPDAWKGARVNGLARNGRVEIECLAVAGAGGR